MPDKKFEILSCTIDEDQMAVAKQWADTFRHNAKDDSAVNMTQLLLACVACGDFKTRPFLSHSTELQAPSDALTIADYISHASRIILDYQNLTGTNREELLKYFPAPGEKNNVFARSATHNVNRSREGVPVEGKGMLIGIMGQLPGIIKTPQDFGVNIAMGGAGKTNFYGKKISDNGCSGHFYFHRNDNEHLLLLGLEQTAPAASALDFLLGAKKYPEEVQQDHDQFGQGHSLKGASDTYTAAGSLYFSDPVYQAKLLLEKGVFPPDKYGAMRVTITDENWPHIKQFLDELKMGAEKDPEGLVELLLSKPKTATPLKGDFSSLSYIALDFNNYLKHVYQILIEESELEAEKKLHLLDLQSRLAIMIKELQKGHIESYGPFKQQISELMQLQGIPPEYQQAILRIQKLFELQFKIDPKLKQTHEELLLKNIYDDLQEESKVILEKLLEVQRHFQQLPFAKEQDSLNLFLNQINTHIKALQNPFSPIPEEVDLLSSWVMCDNPVSITRESMDQLKQTIEAAKSFIKPIVLTEKEELSFSELLLNWEKRFLPFTQINLIDYSQLDFNDLGQKFNAYVDALAQQAEELNYWGHQPSQTMNILNKFFTNPPKLELGHAFVGQYRESTVLRRLFSLDLASLGTLRFKPFEEPSEAYRKIHPNSYWDNINLLLTAGSDVIAMLRILNKQQSAKASWEEMAATANLLKDAIERFKKANEAVEYFQKNTPNDSVEVFESPFFYTIEDEALQKMNGAQLATLCLEELNAKTPSVLIKRIVTDQVLCQRMVQALQDEAAEFNRRKDNVGEKINALCQIRHFWELIQQFKESVAQETKEELLVKLQHAAAESPFIFGAAEALEQAQDELNELQEFFLRLQSLADNKDSMTALASLEEKYKELSAKEQKHYEMDLIRAQEAIYHNYLQKINAASTIEERRINFGILKQLFEKLAPASKVELSPEYEIKQVENNLFDLVSSLESATSVNEKERVFDNPVCLGTQEHFNTINPELTSECAKRCHQQIKRSQFFYENLLKSEFLKKSSPTKPLDTLLNQFGHLLDDFEDTLKIRFIEAALEDNLFRQAISQKAGNKKLTPALIQDLLILKTFRDKKIALSKENEYGNEYDQSINNFYEKALTIRLSELPIKKQAENIMKAATSEFNHRHDTRRLLADIAMIVTAFVGVGIFIGIGRLATGKTLFFSQAKTDREIEFKNQWICNYPQLPQADDNEIQILTAPAA